MSWDAYTKTLKDQHVDLCGIHGMDGSPWAQVPEFRCSQDEVAKVVACVCPEQQQQLAKTVNIMTEGIVLGGKKWAFVRNIDDEEGQIMLLRGKDSDNSKQVMAVAPSKQAVIMGSSSDQNMQGSEVVKVVGSLRTYLKTQNF